MNEEKRKLELVLRPPEELTKTPGVHVWPLDTKHPPRLLIVLRREMTLDYADHGALDDLRKALCVAFGAEDSDVFWVVAPPEWEIELHEVRG